MMKERLFFFQAITALLLCALGGAQALEISPAQIADFLGKSQAEVESVIGRPSFDNGKPIECRLNSGDQRKLSCQYDIHKINIIYASGLANQIWWFPTNEPRRLEPADFTPLQPCRLRTKMDWHVSYDCSKNVFLHVHFAGEGGTGEVNIFGAR